MRFFIPINGSAVCNITEKDENGFEEIPLFVEYSSSNHEIVKVNNSGLMEWASRGTCTITGVAKVGDEQTISVSFKIEAE